MEDIVALVTEETGVTLEQMKLGKPTTALFAKYVAQVIMHEEEIPLEDITAFFGLHRTALYHALLTISDLLKTNKHFKSMYLACIKRLADKEEAA